MCESSLVRMLVVLFSFYWITNCEGAVSVNGRQFVPEGDSTSINCSVTDEVFVGWFDSRSGQQISSDPSQRLHVRTNGTQKYLEITKVIKTDRGKYECRGKTNKAEVMLFVEYSPVLISERSTQKTIFSSIDSGEEITLKCEFDGFPTPEVRFEIAGVEINNSDVTTSPGKASYKLRVTSQNDFAFYTCVATNRRGTATHYIEVYERGPPEPPNNIQVFPNCYKIDVTWEASRKDGGSAVTGYKIELQQGGETVQSENLSVSHRATSLKNLKKGTQFEVRMNSINALGEGEWRTVPVNTTVACTEKHASSTSSKLSVVTLIIMAAHIVL
ncbi:hypothetical protein ACROYT_G029319 [Oculina patagonica]